MVRGQCSDANCRSVRGFVHGRRREGEEGAAEEKLGRSPWPCLSANWARGERGKGALDGVDGRVREEDKSTWWALPHMSGSAAMIRWIQGRTTRRLRESQPPPDSKHAYVTLHVLKSFARESIAGFYFHPAIVSANHQRMLHPSIFYFHILGNV
jgi:hypothetical protein